MLKESLENYITYKSQWIGGDYMGFIFRDHHTDDFNLCVRTRSQPYIAPKRQITIKIPGKDGLACFEDGYDNLLIEFECKITDYDRTKRRKTIRDIAAWLSDTGSLIIDHEDDIEYDVLLTSHNITSESSDPQLPLEEFTVIFECSPHAYKRRFLNNLIWGEADVRWQDAAVYWEGDTVTVDVNNGDMISIQNEGTYKAIPFIVLSGIFGGVSFGDFSITDLNGSLYIDSRNKLVYSLSGTTKINQLSKFSGKFPELNPGVNLFPISGTITNLKVEVFFRHTYL
jgi:phage-related protein